MFDITQVVPILEVICDEPSGSITRKVRPLSFDMETLYHFWSKAREFPTLFSQVVTDDFGEFCALFMVYDKTGNMEPKGLFWVIDDWVGILYMTDISVPVEATVHYTFFDRRQRGRVPLVKEMLKFVFRKYQFNRLNATLPLYAKASFPFIKAVGFKDEGRKRQCRLHKGQYFDEELFGILKSEVLTDGK